MIGLHRFKQMFLLIVYKALVFPFTIIWPINYTIAFKQYFYLGHPNIFFVCILYKSYKNLLSLFLSKLSFFLIKQFFIFFFKNTEMVKFYTLIKKILGYFKHKITNMT